MKTTNNFYGDWNKGFLPMINGSFSTDNIIPEKIFSNNLFFVLNIDLNFGETTFDIVENIAKEINHIYSFLISSLQTKDLDSYRNVKTNFNSLLNKNDSELNDFFDSLMSNSIDSDLIKNIEFLFEKSSFLTCFKNLFDTTSAPNNYTVFLYFITHSVEILELYSFMKENNLYSITLSNKSYVCNKITKSGVVTAEISIKGNDSKAVMHSYFLDLLDNKDFTENVNLFLFNQLLKKKPLFIKDHSSDILVTLDKVLRDLDFQENERKIILLAANYSQYRIIIEE